MIVESSSRPPKIILCPHFGDVSPMLKNRDVEHEARESKHRAGLSATVDNKAVIDRRLRPRCCHFKRPKRSPVQLPATGITAHSW